MNKKDWIISTILGTILMILVLELLSMVIERSVTNGIINAYLQLAEQQ